MCCPTTTPQGLRYVLATVTLPTICVVLAVPRTTLNLQANRRTRKNSAWIERKWGSEYKEMGDWISTRAPGEVASASS